MLLPQTEQKATASYANGNVEFVWVVNIMMTFEVGYNLGILIFRGFRIQCIDKILNYFTFEKYPKENRQTVGCWVGLGGTRLR